MINSPGTRSGFPLIKSALFALLLNVRKVNRNFLLLLIFELYYGKAHVVKERQWTAAAVVDFLVLLCTHIVDIG